ncbi:MAG: isochorismatase family protein [Candidatus Rokubacteria bacterium]|nr:isochorismatase family protein [Candidatus Rokubacteria bacterium]
MAGTKTALIVIDAQQEYFAPTGKVVLPGGPAAKKIAEALAWARRQDLPVLHVVHESRKPNAPIFAPGSPALEIHPEARPAPGEPVVQKHLPGAFTGTKLEEILRQAAHLGFQVTVLSDATAAMAVKGPDGETIPADQVHKTHLGSLSGFLAEVKSVRDVAK